MAVVIADLRQHLEGQLTAKKNALNETEETLRKYVGDRAVEGQARQGRGRGGGFTPGKGLVRGRSLAERLGNHPGAERVGDAGDTTERTGGDLEDVVNKSVMSRVVKEVKSREETLEEQKSDKKVVDRNRRMFGALVGTLQKFNKEEIKKKDVLEKKKVVEKKVEEKTEREKEEIKNRKKELFDEQKKKKKDIQILQIQMKRVEEYEAWEKSKKAEVNFIRTKSSQPDIYWLPKVHTEKSEALLAESREAVEKEIEERKEKFEAELISIEKKMTADLERKKIGKEEKLDQSGDMDESFEAKPDEEEDGEEFMGDRRVVEREADQAGERNGGDLRMTLKNDLASERIVRRKEDSELKEADKEERFVIVKDEKEMEERKLKRDQEKQKEEERRIRKEEERKRENGRSEKSADVKNSRTESKEKDEARQHKAQEHSEHAVAKNQDEKQKAQMQESKEEKKERGGRGRDSSTDSDGDRKPKRMPARKRQRSGRSSRRPDNSRRRADSSSSSSEEERRTKKRHASSSSSSDSDEKSSNKRRGVRPPIKKRSKSSSSDERHKKVRKGSKHDSTSDDSSSDSD